MAEVCPFRDRTVLELGAKDGRHSAAALAMGACRCLAIEGRRSNLAPARRCEYTARVEFVEADVASLPLRASFDIVMAYGILYHLPHPIGLIGELRALCDGFLFVSTHCADPVECVDGYWGSFWDEPAGTDSALSPGRSFWLAEPELMRALENNQFRILKVAHYDTRGTTATWVAARAGGGWSMARFPCVSERRSSDARG